MFLKCLKGNDFVVSLMCWKETNGTQTVWRQKALIVKLQRRENLDSPALLTEDFILLAGFCLTAGVQIAADLVLRLVLLHFLDQLIPVLLHKVFAALFVVCQPPAGASQLVPDALFVVEAAFAALQGEFHREAAGGESVRRQRPQLQDTNSWNVTPSGTAPF